MVKIYLLENKALIDLKYLFLFLVLFLSGLSYIGYYLYNFDKQESAVNSINSSPKKKYTRTEQIIYYWKNVKPEQLREDIKKSKIGINAPRITNGRTKLHYAVLYGKSSELIDILISNGADVHLKDKFIKNGELYMQFKPLFYALIRKEQAFEFTQKLLKYDTNLNETGFIKDRTVTPLMFAAYNRLPLELIRILLEKGADPNFSGTPTYPLILAAIPNKTRNISYINPAVIQLLLDHNADITKKDIKGKTAYDYMKENPIFSKTELFKQLSKKTILK